MQLYVENLSHSSSFYSSSSPSPTLSSLHIGAAVQLLRFALSPLQLGKSGAPTALIACRYKPRLDLRRRARKSCRKRALLHRDGRRTRPIRPPTLLRQARSGPCWLEGGLSGCAPATLSAPTRPVAATKALIMLDAPARQTLARRDT